MVSEKKLQDHENKNSTLTFILSTSDFQCTHYQGDSHQEIMVVYNGLITAPSLQYYLTNNQKT